MQLSSKAFAWFQNSDSASIANETQVQDEPEASDEVPYSSILTACQACGKYVSRKAHFCPNCGHLLTEYNRGCLWLLSGFSGIFAIFTAIGLADRWDTLAALLFIILALVFVAGLVIETVFRAIEK